MKITLVSTTKDGPAFTIEGVATGDCGDSMLKGLFQDEEFMRSTTWITIKHFSATVRAQYIKKGVEHLTKTDCSDILNTECALVLNAFLERVRWVPYQASCISLLDTESILRVWKKAKTHYWNRVCLCRYCALDLVPIILPLMMTGDAGRVEIENRLNK